VADIVARIKKKHGKAPTGRTIYRVLDSMVDDKIVRKEGREFLYAPHDILRDRWLKAFDTIFKWVAPAGYDVDFIMGNYAFIIMPDKMAVCELDPEYMKQAVEELHSIVPPGALAFYGRAAGKIEKGESSSRSATLSARAA